MLYACLFARQLNSAVWLNREARPDYLFDEDPWISVTDHGPAVAGGKIVYGKAGGVHPNLVHRSRILPIHNGAWLR